MTTDISDIRSAVKKVAWGFFLILFHINIGTIDILPDWAGYALMVSALSFIALEEESAKLLKPIGTILVVWNVIEWVLKIFGLDAYLNFIAIIPSVLNIYFSFQLFTNLAGIAKKYSCPQEKRLLVFRTLYVICTVISVSLLYLGLLSEGSEVYMMLMMGFVVINLILALCILFTLFGLSSALGEYEERIQTQITPEMPSGDTAPYMAPPGEAYENLTTDEAAPQDGGTE